VGGVWGRGTNLRFTRFLAILKSLPLEVFASQLEFQRTDIL